MFPACFIGFLRVRTARRKILGVFEVFLGVFEKTKEKKDRDLACHKTLPYHCNLCGQLQRCQMPDIENSRKNSRKGCQQPEKHPKNSCFDCFSGVSGVFPAVFRLFYRDPLGTLFGCFFRLFSMSGIWHLCSWPQRLQPYQSSPFVWRAGKNMTIECQTLARHRRDSHGETATHEIDSCTPHATHDQL